jgi:DNA modification methylase
MSWTYFDRGLRLWKGGALEMLRRMKSSSVSGVVTDPPYGISFMGSAWDYELPDPAIWRELHRVLKPGAYIVVFSSTRTVHRLGVDLEDSGFQPRDLIGWVTYQGFPKSHDISQALDRHAGAEREVIGQREVWGLGAQRFNDKETGVSGNTGIPITAPTTREAKLYQGYGTALKPAQEPALLMRKAPEGTLAQNVLRYGTGGLNIDGCRYAYGDPAWIGPAEDWGSTGRGPSSIQASWSLKESAQVSSNKSGRWPANLYQCPKVSRTEREQYTDGLQSISGAQATHRKEGSAGLNNPRAGASRGASEVRNRHPTVKPRQLIRWLLRLVTPPGDMSGPILDPFLGSGTALLAGLEEGIRVWGSEREEQYQKLIQHRVEEATRQGYLF